MVTVKLTDNVLSIIKYTYLFISVVCINCWVYTTLKSLREPAYETESSTSSVLDATIPAFSCGPDE
jgi:hypothetical protein